MGFSASVPADPSRPLRDDRRAGRAVQVVAATALLQLSATGAQALDSAPGPDLVTIEVSARVVDRCGFSVAPKNMTAAADLTVAQAIAFDFTLDCNTPFVIGVRSANGAMTHRGAPDASGFAFAKRYEVGLAVATSGAGLAPLPCHSDTLTADASARCAFYGSQVGEGLASGDDTAIGKPGTLTVRWDDGGGGPRLAAGDYTDTLTIAVAARF